MYFQLRSEQVGLVRRKRNAEALAGTFSGSKIQAKVDPVTGDVLATPPNGAPTRDSFDGQGFVARITTPMGRQWSLTSDSHGRATSITNPSGSVASISYDPRGRISQVERDGQPLFQFQHDATGNVIRTSFADGTNEFQAFRHEQLLTAVARRSGITQHFEWDDQQCLTSIIDGKGNRTRYEYGRFTKPDRAIFPDGSSEEYKYDEKGQLAGFSQSGNSPVDLKIDAGRIRSAVYVDGLKLRYNYDDQGRLTSAASGETETRWQFRDDRLVGEESPNSAIKYLHDESGHPTGLVYPTGSEVAFSWDADGRLAAIRDWSGAETKWNYSQSDQGWVVEYPGGVTAQTRVLPTGLTASIEVRNRGTQAKLWQYGVKYDAEDRIAFRLDSLSGQQNFAYDADGRLTQAGEESFSYDDADNLHHPRMPGAAFNAVNQFAMSASLDDGRGNLIAGLAQGGAWEFGWDGRNRLINAIGPQNAQVSYGYDALDRLISREQDGRRTEYVWAGETLIAETERDTTGQVCREQEYLFIPGTSTLFATRINGRVFYAHCDTLGTPHLLTDAKGVSVWGAVYDAFGVPTRLYGEPIHQPWRFPGQYADHATGLHYNRFRIYNPFLGRYLSRDPLGYTAGLNLYAYAGNDPVNSADPTGLWGWKGVLSAVAAVAVGVAVTAAIIATAPVSIPAMLVTGAAIVAGGAAAGAVGFGLNQALNEKEFCATCIAKEALKGLGVGALAALPFAFLPASAGVAAFMGVGGLSGGIGYMGGVFTHPGTAWNWGDFAGSVGFGMVTAGVGRYLAGSSSAATPRLPQDVAINPVPPRPLPLNRPVGLSAAQNAEVQSDIAAARAQGATDFRVNQQQVNAQGERVGINRPDLQYTDANGQRVYTEYDTPSSNRGPLHEQRILSNDPNGTVIQKIIP